MQHFPFDRYTFLAITVERPKPELAAALHARGYVYLRDHGPWGDQLHVHRSIPGFDAAVRKHSAARPPGA